MLRNSILVKIRYVFALSTAYEYFLIITHNSQGLRLGSLLVPLVVTGTKLSWSLKTPHQTSNMSLLKKIIKYMKNVDVCFFRADLLVLIYFNKWNKDNIWELRVTTKYCVLHSWLIQ